MGEESSQTRKNKEAVCLLCTVRPFPIPVVRRDVTRSGCQGICADPPTLPARAEGKNRNAIPNFTYRVSTQLHVYLGHESPSLTIVPGARPREVPAFTDSKYLHATTKKHHQAPHERLQGWVAGPI